MSRVSIDQLWVPDDPSGADAQDLLAAVEVSRQARIHTWGNDDLAYTPAEMIQAFADEYEWYVVLLARVDGRIVGRAGIAMPLMDNTETAFITLDILPAARGQGAGRELLAAAEQFARGENRRVVYVETHHPASSLPRRGDQQLPASDGEGFLPLSSREVVFAQLADYELRRVQEFSACTVPLDPALAESLTAECLRPQGGEYRVHRWLGSCPHGLLEKMARLEAAAASGFSDDDGGSGEPWTGEHVRRAEELERNRGRKTLVTAVEHLPSGALVGMTTISVLATRDDVVFQDDTVVMPGHRGKELGQLIKVANMDQLHQQVPNARRIYTWNVTSNAYLQEVNRKLGFSLAGVTGQWEKRLDAHR